MHIKIIIKKPGYLKNVNVMKTTSLFKLDAKKINLDGIRKNSSSKNGQLLNKQVSPTTFSGTILVLKIRNEKCFSGSSDSFTLLV